MTSRPIKLLIPFLDGLTGMPIVGRILVLWTIWPSICGPWD
jgi:hypothetical protein